MKKRISLYLAAIMIFNLFVTLALPARVEAQQILGMGNVSVGQFLTTGGTAWTPVLTTAQTINDPFMLQWNMGPPQQLRRYHLQFYIADGVLANVFVHRRGPEIMDVFFELTDSDGNIIHDPNPSVGQDFNIFNPFAGGFEFIGNLIFDPDGPNATGSIDSLLNPNRTIPVGAGRPGVDNGPWAWDEPELRRPSFTIVPGGGFSFQYGTDTNRANYHFRWDAATNNFQLTVDGSPIQPGLIYDFYLRESQLANWNWVDFNTVGLTPMRVMKGIRAGDIIASPWANASNPEGTDRRGVYHPPNAANTPNYVIGDDTIDIDLTTPDINIVPGDEYRGIELWIPLPEVAFESAGSVSYGHPPNYVGIGPFDVSVIMGGRNILFRLTAGPAPGNLSLVGTPGWDVINERLVDGYIVFDVINLEAGIIFDTAVQFLNSPGNPNFISRRTDLPGHTVFTLPNFNIRHLPPLPDTFMIDIVPFRRLADLPGGIPNLLSGYYMLLNGDHPSALMPLREHPEPVWFDANNPTEFVSIPVRLQNQVNLQIFFSADRFDLPEHYPGIFNSKPPHPYSQIIGFTPPDVVWITPIPERFAITSVNQFPLERDALREESIVEMILNWDIAPASLINAFFADPDNEGQDLVLYYNIDFSETPDHLAPNQNLTTVRVTITNDSGSLYVDFEIVSHANENDIPEGQDSILNEELLEAWRLAGGGRISLQPVLAHATYRVSVPVRINAIHAHHALRPARPSLLFPRVWFLTVWYAGHTPSEISRYYDLTLSDMPMPQVPPPQNIQLFIDIEDRGNFRASWDVPGSQLHQYIIDSFNLPLDSARIAMNVYISQNEEFMRDNFTNRPFLREDDVPGRINEPDVYTMHFDFETAEFDEDGRAIIDFTGSPRDRLRETGVPNGFDVVHIQGDFTSPEDLMEAIANLATYEVNVAFEGLDENERYFVVVDIVVGFAVDEDMNDIVFENKAELFNHDLTRASFFSSMVGVVTPAEPTPPDGYDRVPPAPFPINQRDVRSDTVTIYWEPIFNADAPYLVPEDASYAVIEYEIVRIHNSQMNQGMLNDRRTMQEIWEGMPEGFEIRAFRTVNIEGIPEDQSLLEITSGGTGTVSVGPPQFEINANADEVAFTDNTVLSNELYFYYVRTVRTMGGITNYSVWSAISVTTLPIQPPRNLIAFAGDEDDFDRYTMFWISFEAPMHDLEALGRDVHLYYQIREDGEDWGEPVRMAPATLMADPEPVLAELGWYRFMYRITGLEDDTQYEIRVRMTDHNDVASLWSNVATWRTEIDQRRMDEDRITEDWLRHLQREMEALLRTNYWISVNNEIGFEVFMRPSMTHNIISEAVGNAIQLPTSQLGLTTRTVYYIPMSLYRAANDAELGFRVNNGNPEVQILLPPNFINLAENNAALDMARSIDRNIHADSFVRLVFHWANIGEVEGNETVGQAVNVDFSIVGASQSILEWDRNLAAHMRERVVDWARDPIIIAEFRGAVAHERVINEDMSRYVLHLLNVATERVVLEVSRARQSLTSLGYRIERIDRNMSVILRGFPETGALLGHFNIGVNWAPLEVITKMGGRGFFANRAGRYAFTGRVISIPGIQHVPGGGTMTGIVAQFGLDEFLGGSHIDMDGIVTRHMVIGTAARVSGAPRATDPLAWMRANGVEVSAVRMHEGISQQEAVSILMSLYGIRTNTEVSRINIRNHSQVNNLSGEINPLFMNGVRAALDMGIVQANSFNPSGHVTIGELLRMLRELDSRAGVR